METSKFNPNNIEDMNAYLSDFIKNMKSTSKESTSMSLEDAQWHLTACLNYQFCNANTGRTDMLYDTIVTTISINDDIVTMTDINSSFQEISTEVSRIYNSYDIPNKQIVFIHSVIDTENLAKGEATVKSIMATTERNDHYYFDEWDYLCLDTIFPYNNEYLWNEEAINELEYYVKLFGTQYINEDYYYVSLGHITYKYYDYPITDPSSPYKYRLYYCGHCLEESTVLTGGDMVFYLDSYLGLACNTTTHYGNMIDAVISDIVDYTKQENGELLCHDLTVWYGTIVLNNQIEY